MLRDKWGLTWSVLKHIAWKVPLFINRFTPEIFETFKVEITMVSLFLLMFYVPSCSPTTLFFMGKRLTNTWCTYFLL